MSDVLKNHDLQDERSHSAGAVQADGTSQCVETGTITLLATPNRTLIAGVQGLTLERIDPNPEGTKAGRTRCSEMSPRWSKATTYLEEFNG